jgi:NAD(P)H-dependent flavin oxidoreductase YrpB (nitropropane dioxygenase family)
MTLLRTPLCELFGIDIPIFNVGFGQSATPELAAAVSNAGGCGVLGFTGGGMPPEEVHARIDRTRTLTERPFGRGSPTLKRDRQVRSARPCFPHYRGVGRPRYQGHLRVRNLPAHDCFVMSECRRGGSKPAIRVIRHDGASDRNSGGLSRRRAMCTGARRR